MIHYLDASALVKRYLPEHGSTALRTLFRKSARVAMARIGHAEVASAFTRAARAGAISDDTRDKLVSRLEAELAGFTIVELRSSLARSAIEILERHPLRANDALHLAAALALRSQGTALSFWCADDHLLAAADDEGLRAIRPA